MIKRLSFLFCVVLMVVIMVAVPAFAAETDDFYIIEQPKDYFYSGSGYANFSVTVHGDVDSYRWEYRKSATDPWTYASWAYTNTFKNEDVYKSEYYLVRCIVTSKSGDVIVSNEAAFINYPNYFLFYCSRAINFVTSWVGNITDALISSDGAFYSLLPVLAIGISITFVLIVSKIFKSFSWGL